MCGGHVVVHVLVYALITCTPTHPSPIPQPTYNRGVFVNELIRYSESVQYEPLLVPTVRLRRHAPNVSLPLPPLHIYFSALHRNFTLKLRPDSSVFAEDVVFETPSGHVNFSTARLYTGQVVGEEESRVQGLVTADGRFDGTIESAGEVYYVEPASRYAETGTGTHSPRVHTIIYRASDVERPPWSALPCASALLHSRRRRQSDHVIQLTESSVLKTYLNTPPDAPRRPRLHASPPTSPRTPFLYNSLNRPRVQSTPACDTQLLSNGSHKHINKRATVDHKKTTCMLYLQADHLFFQKYGTEEACIEVMTRHVQRVNVIYRNTDFNQDGRADNISFMIKRIKVHTVDSSVDPGYRFPGNYGVEKFLELFSEEDYDAFCLAYMFTYRDFEMGTLGLAWTGDLKNAGGVCEKNGHYRGSLKSLNTGIVTLLNYGKHVPPAVSHVTLAHEIGHNFGSPHDPEMCTPGGEDGNYIMFARATSGDKKNNNKFSPCSLNSINPVLNTKARSHVGCFTEPQASICGNGVVEAGEECDCGWEEDCRDSCCFPQRRYPPPGEPPCRLTPNSVCSPSQGPCCTSGCQLKFGDKCRDDNGCRDSSFCNGRAPACPPSVNKPNKTVCNQEFVCFMGECTGSICLAYGLESCQCLPKSHDPPTKACELCCKRPGDDQPCVSSWEWNEAPFDVPDMYSKPGTPCNDYNGYCDVFQKCREVDPSGPLATLRNLLLSDQNIASVKKWLADHWYAVLVLVTTFILLLMLSTRLVSRHSNVKLKSMTIIHSATTETVRLPPEGDASANSNANVTVHPPAVRSKLPLHRKVREKKLHSKVMSRRKKMTLTQEADEKKKAAGTTIASSSPEKKKTRKDGAKSKRQKTTTTTRSPIYENVKQNEPKVSSANIINTRLKRSNRVATEAPVVSCPNVRQKQTDGVSPAKKRKRRKEDAASASAPHRRKESAFGTEATAIDPMGKVHNWLLQSARALPKSKSSPVDLAKSRPQVKIAKLSQPRSCSAGNLKKDAGKDKVKLQVLYRPPFKFSLKLRNSVGMGSVRTRLAPAGTRPDGMPPAPAGRAAVLVTTPSAPVDDIDSNVHTVPSDLDVLLSESEFLFSDA